MCKRGRNIESESEINKKRVQQQMKRVSVKSNSRMKVKNKTNDVTRQHKHMNLIALDGK